MPANIHSLSAELLLAIIESIVTIKTISIDLDNVARTIFCGNEDIHALSQVNRQLRPLCLPLLYKHIVIVITEDDVSRSRAGQFESFRRIMEQKPQLAKLVRYVYPVCWENQIMADLRISI
jgi:hypothetical protein